MKVKCSYCGKEIEKSPYSLKIYSKHFCNSECYYKNKRLVQEYIDKGKYIELKIKDYTIKFDKEDLSKIKKYRWGLLKCPNNIYCRATTRELMHRVVTNSLNNNLIVDHINHNTLDNRKCNLRVCSSLENAKNLLLEKTYTKTKYTYITIDNRWKTTFYKVRITENSKRIYLGQYPTLEEAIKIRNDYLKSHNRYFEYLQDRSDNNKSLLRK